MASAVIMVASAVVFARVLVLVGIAAPQALSGFVGSPGSARSSRDTQYTFVNGRFVRDKVLAHALREAYSDAAPEYVASLKGWPKARWAPDALEKLSETLDKIQRGASTQ